MNTKNYTLVRQEYSSADVIQELMGTLLMTSLTIQEARPWRRRSQEECGDVMTVRREIKYEKRGSFKIERTIK